MSTLTSDVEADFVIPDYEFQPKYIGNSWKRDEDDNFILPKYSLGYQAISWAEDNLLNDEGEPWRFTKEQARIILWWYEVDENGVFVTRDFILQRLKGWG